MVQFYSSKQRKVKSDNLRVIAESLDVKDKGVAHYQGKIFFITDLLPGEQAQIQFTEEKRQVTKAKVSKRLTDVLIGWRLFVVILASVVVINNNM